MRAGWSLLLLVTVLSGCERTQAPVADQSVRPAKLFRVSSLGATVSHDFVGRVEAAQAVDVSFEVAGELVQLPILEAQDLQAGDLVARLDPTDFELAVREAEVQVRLAAQDLERKEALLRQQGIPRSVVDDARANHDLWVVRLDQARERLADTRIVAPFDARVAARYVDNRSRVQPGEPVARLLDLSHLTVVANVPAGLLATVTPDRVVAMTARFDFLPDEPFPLTYRESRGEASPVAQTYEVSFTLQRSDAVNILPGMSARVRVDLRADSRGSIQVPASALLSDPESNFFVWVYDPATSLVERRRVVVGSPFPTGIGIRRGLTDGELVVMAGASQLQEGMRVRPLGDPVSQATRRPADRP